MFVKVTYQAWDHNGEEIPAELHPRVGFKPLQTSLYNGMLTSREVWGTLNPDGTGEVMLENTPGILYVPFIEWLTDPSQWAEKVENRAVGRSEWKPIIPGDGGDITDLADLTPYGPIVAVLGPPPAATQGIVWIDLTDQTVDGALVYAPEGAY